MLNNNWIAFAVTLALALLWLRLNDFLAHRGFISAALSRKIIHIGTGPIYVLCWLLFDQSPWSRYIAALIPFGITLQFLLVGIGVIKDQAAVDAMSRSGDRREILRGPLFYGIVFVVLTLVYWLETPIGIIALMLLCGGDGLADIVGTRMSGVSLPWSRKKTWYGTLAMFFGGWLLALFVIAVYWKMGIFDGSFEGYLLQIMLISLGASIVESLPFRDIDNITVPLVAVLSGHLLF